MEIDWYLRDNSLTHEMVEERGPFFVTEVGWESVYLDITLTNTAGDTLLLHPNIDWDLHTPTGRIYYWDWEDKELDLMGAELIGFSGYSNFFANTFVFSNGYVLRDINDYYGYPDPMYWSVKLVTSTGTFETRGLGSMDMRELLPVAYHCSAVNPYDCLLPASAVDRPELVGAKITGAGLIRKGFSDYLSLNLTTVDGVPVVFESARVWTISGADAFWVDNDNLMTAVHEYVSEHFVGLEVLGFAGCFETALATVFLSDGTRIDQSDMG